MELYFDRDIKKIRPKKCSIFDITFCILYSDCKLKQWLLALYIFHLWESLHLLLSPFLVDTNTARA